MTILKQIIRATAFALLIMLLAAVAVLTINRIRSRWDEQLGDERRDCIQDVRVAYLSLCLAMGNPPIAHRVSDLLNAAAQQYKASGPAVVPINAIYFDDDLSKWRDWKSHKNEIATYAHYELSDGSKLLFWATFANESFDGPDREVPNTAKARYITIDSATTASTPSTQISP